MAYTPSADGTTVTFGDANTFLVDQHNRSFGFLPNGANNLTTSFIDQVNLGAGSGLNKFVKIKGVIYATNGTYWWQYYTTASTIGSRLVGSGSILLLTTPSPSGTTATYNATIPAPNAAIVDQNGDIWCYGDGTTGGRHTVTKNGLQIVGSDAALIYFDGSTIYYKDGTPAWHSWNGSSFVSSSDPTTAVPGAPINLTSPTQSGTSITLSFQPPSPSGGVLDHGTFQVQYKAHSSGTWLTGPAINYCTPSSGTFTDSHSNTWSLNSSYHPVINGTVTDTASNATMLMLYAGTVYQIDTTGAYYSTTPTGTIVSAPSWAGPTTTSPLSAVVVSSLTAGTSYDFQVDVSNSHGTSSYTSTYTISTASVGPGPSASSAFLTADFSVPMNYASPGTGQQIVSPRLWGVVDGAAGDDGRFGARGNNTNNDSFCAFTATTYLTPAGTINPGLWVFIGNLAFSPTNPWFSGTSVNTSAFANLLAGFPSVDPLGVSGIIFGLDFTFGNATDYGTAMGNLASYFYNGGSGRLMSNGQPLPVLGFTGHNEPSPGTYNAATVASYYSALKTAVKAVNPDYLVVGPQPDWWNNVGSGMDDFMSRVSGMDGISWDAFPEGSGMTQGSALWTNSNFKDAFGSGVTNVIGKLQYTPEFMLQMGAIDSACACGDGSDYYGAVWKAIQQVEQINNAPVPMYCAHWDSFLQGTSGLIDESMSITPTGYLVAQGVRKITGSRWAVPTNSASLLTCAVIPSAGNYSLMIINAGQGAQNGKTVALSHWPVNTTGDGTANVWQMTSSSTGDGSYSTVAVTAGVTDALDFPDPSITIISSGDFTGSGPAYYVSPTGSDTANGSLATPFQTLGKAQTSMAGGSTKKTLLMPGTYTIASGWSFTSGTDDNQTWEALNGPDTVIIEGSSTGYINAPHVTGLTFKGLTFQNFGLVPSQPGGIYISGSGHTIRWNKFLNFNQCVISGAGLQDSLIDSNTIDGVAPGNPPGVTTSAFSAIELWLGSSGNTISHNLLQNCEGGGIDFNTGASDPSISDNIIDRNKLINVCTSVVDNGAIYMMDRTNGGTGNEITNNVICNYGDGTLSDQTKGIYLDDGMSGVQVSGNLVYGTPGEWAIQYHGGENNTVTGNIFALKSSQQLALYQTSSQGNTAMGGNTFEGNIVYYDSGAPSPIWDRSGSPTNNPTVSGNLYYAASGSVPNTGSIVDASPTTANPQLTNVAGGNFYMPLSAPAYSAISWQTLKSDQGPLPYVA